MPEQKSLRAYELIRLRAEVKGHGGFTLVELIITIAIIAVLLFALVLVLDPLELIAQARDTRRVSDLEAMSSAIDIAKAELVGSSGTWDPDGNYDEACSGELDQRVFVSVPGDMTGTCISPPNDLPAGWNYGCAIAGSGTNIDGTGWLPIDLTAGGTTNVPISHLPTDPISTFASGYYYTYVCDRSSRGFEITARMASKKHRTGGEGDVQSTDSGDDIFVYETGTDLNLDPKAPIAYWPFDEGTGTSTVEVIGSSTTNDGTLSGNTIPTWQSGASCILGNCLDFGGTYGQNTRVDAGDDTSLDITSNLSVVAWVYVESGPAAEGRTAVSKFDYNGAVQRGWNFGAQWTSDDFTFEIWHNTTGQAAARALNFFANNLNVWRHMAGTYTPSIATRLYIDGAEVDSDTTAVPSAIVYATPSDPFTIGRRSVDTQSEFDGRIDEVLYYNRALTAAEINYQYESLKP